MAGGARSLPAVRRRKFNYIIRCEICQVFFYRQFTQKFSQNLYFTNNKYFDIIYLSKEKEKKMKVIWYFRFPYCKAFCLREISFKDYNDMIKNLTNTWWEHLPCIEKHFIKI